MSLTKRQSEIIDAALKLTAEGGIQNLTIKNLGNALRSKSEIVKTMIGRFDEAVPAESAELHGLEAIAAFARSRFRQVQADPPLARVMFAEELFMADAEFAERMLEMMHRHKETLERHFREAQERGEIRKDLPVDMLFRLFFGPVWPGEHLISAARARSS